MSGVTTASVVGAAVTGVAGAATSAVGSAITGGGGSSGGSSSQQMQMSNSPMGGQNTSNPKYMQSSKAEPIQQTQVVSVPTKPFNSDPMGIGDDVWANRLSAILNNKG